VHRICHAEVSKQLLGSELLALGFRHSSSNK